VATARSIEDSEKELRELRLEEWSDLVLAVVVLGGALVATALYPSLVWPLFVGGLVVAAVAGHAFVRRLDLVDQLLVDRDAYAIPEIQREAARAASRDSRRELAASIRKRLTRLPGCPLDPRVVAVAEELKELAGALEDEELSFEPACAVLCRQLLTNGEESPLLNELVPIEDLRARVLQIRAGFSRAAVAA
jgi:hypothetical protein